MAINQPSGGADPSMEDILASIRRILSEDEATGSDAPAQVAAPQPAAQPRAATAGRASASPAATDVFALDASMIVREPPENAMGHSPPGAAEDAWRPGAQEAPPLSDPYALARDQLTAPEAAAAAAQSVGSLRRTVEAGRSSMLLRPGGPTLEEMVREELRPVLKSWLDTYLPPLVERLVRAEIERVVGRVDT